MSTHKHFDKICCVVLAVTLLLTALFMNAENLGVHKASTVMGYENKLFDTSTVHTIDIIMDDWDEFTANCKSEEYYTCSVVIDNEAYKNVAIRGKGNTSLTQVESYGNGRYSFKIEFDHYDSTKTYYGLDKLCLNNIIQDNTLMKDYLTYQMMAEMGVASPLCSYVYITVNGEDWGLYLAVEGIEESFLQRNYGSNYGEVYKPDSQSMGGGRGNGEKFDMDDFLGNTEDADTSTTTQDTTSSNTNQTTPQMPGNMQGGQMPSGNMQGGQMPGGQMQGGSTPPELPSGETAIDPNAGNSQGGMALPNNEATTDGSTSDTNGMMQQGGTVPEMGGQMPDGNMSSGDMQGGDKGGRTNGSDDVLLKYIDDEIESYANIFNNAKTDVSDSDKERLIASLKKLSNGEDLDDTVDIEKVIRYFVVHNFVLNFDSYTGSMIHNYYLYEKDGQMQMVPWDYNLAFGGFESAGDATNLVNYPIDSPVSGGNAEDRPMIAWIFANEEYTELYHQYFAEFISEYFDSGYFEEMIDSVSAMIAPYVEKDPTKFCTYEEFETGVSTLKEFCLLRAESITGQINGTIGSTSSTQSNDTLIDAGDLQITDMGSMNNTMGGGMDKPDGNMGGSMQKPQGGTNNGEVLELPSGNGEANNDDTISSNTTTDQAQTPSENPDTSNGNISSDGTVSQIPNNGTVPELPTGENAIGDGTVPEFPSGETAVDPNAENANGQVQKPDENGLPGEMGQMGNPEQVTANSTASWIWISISAGVLLLGLGFALFFKRRR